MKRSFFSILLGFVIGKLLSGRFPWNSSTRDEKTHRLRWAQRQQKQPERPQSSIQQDLEDCANQLDKSHEELFVIQHSKTATTTTAKRNIRAETNSTTKHLTAAICAIQKDGLYYVDEWVDYHLAIGFETIYIYDNSDDFEVQQWAKSRNPNQVVVRHYPGEVRQVPAYTDCLQQTAHSKEEQRRFGVSRFKHDWLAFFDIDEFLVLKQHQSVSELLEDVVKPPAAGLSLHRLTFYFGTHLSSHSNNTISVPANQSIYQPIPVLKRFQYRLQKVDSFVKTIAKSDKISKPSVHYVDHGRHKLLTIDTTGKKVLNGYGPRRPMDVAVIHHYETKSLEEFQSKCRRGDAYFGTYKQSPNATSIDREVKLEGNQRACRPREWILESFYNSTVKAGGVTFDDSAWRFLSEKVPSYRRYSSI